MLTLIEVETIKRLSTLDDFNIDSVVYAWIRLNSVQVCSPCISVTLKSALNAQLLWYIFEIQ